MPFETEYSLARSASGRVYKSERLHLSSIGRIISIGNPYRTSLDRTFPFTMELRKKRFVTSGIGSTLAKGVNIRSPAATTSASNTKNFLAICLRRRDNSN
jgi:hypothetical protein